jgi:hypothetical protein
VQLLEIRSRMIGLTDTQLEAIMRVATPLSEGKCQEFLERVAAALAVVLQMRGQINDDDVAVAAQLALRIGCGLSNKARCDPGYCKRLTSAFSHY